MCIRDRYGAPETPEILHTQGLVEKEIPIHEGWNWISFNLDMPDKDVNVVLESLKYPENLLIKRQGGFSNYVTGPNAWFGTAQTLGYTEMYQLRGTQNDTISLLGYLIDPDTVDIPIHVGWNWIGYLPQQGAHVNDALSSLTPLTGDIIKNQNSFAQYVAGVGWVGSLNYMEAPNGYLLKSSTAGVINMHEPDITVTGLTAGNTGTTSQGEEEEATVRTTVWTVNPAEFEHSMTCLLYTSPSPRDATLSRMPSSA